MTAPSNLLGTLVAFAAAGRAQEEDPITEILAWLLEANVDLCVAFVATLPRRKWSSQRRTPRVRTQEVVRHHDGKTGRYDLVLDWPDMRLVVEIKTNSDLTWHVDTDGKPYHQVTMYLEVAKALGNHCVLTLAPGLVDVGAEAREHDCYLGNVTWQAVHDAFGQVLRKQLSPDIAVFTKQFIDLLEQRGMATPKLTFDAVTSVYRYAKFRQAIEPMLRVARDTVFQEGLLPGYLKPTHQG